MNKAYKELGISYNTAHKIYQRIRKAIYDFVSREDEVLKGEARGGGELWTRYQCLGYLKGMVR